MRSTHNLEGTEFGTNQDMERKQASEWDLQTGRGRRRDWSEHEKEASQQGTLTSWRGQTLGLVRTQNESEQVGGHSPTGEVRGRDLSGHGPGGKVRGTHFLEGAEVRTGQDMERE